MLRYNINISRQLLSSSELCNQQSNVFSKEMHNTFELKSEADTIKFKMKR